MNKPKTITVSSNVFWSSITVLKAHRNDIEKWAIQNFEAEGQSDANTKAFKDSQLLSDIIDSLEYSTILDEHPGLLLSRPRLLDDLN